MREIKFRVCTIDKMFYIVNDGEYQLTFGMGPNWSLWDEEGEICNSSESDTKIMQYTGLKVNGERGLYEGDIVPVKVSIHKGWKQGWVHFNKNAVVEYEESEMRFMFVAVIEGYGKRYIPFDKSIRQSYKIIGNIYENPELLESGQHE